MSTATTTVLSILLLATRPILVRRGLRVSGIGQLALSLQRFDPRDVPSHGANARRIRQLARGELEAQSEELLTQFGQTRFRIGHRVGGFLSACWLPITRARLPWLPLRHFPGPPSS